MSAAWCDAYSPFVLLIFGNVGDESRPCKTTCRIESGFHEWMMGQSGRSLKYFSLFDRHAKPHVPLITFSCKPTGTTVTGFTLSGLEVVEVILMIATSSQFFLFVFRCMRRDSCYCNASSNSDVDRCWAIPSDTPRGFDGLDLSNSLGDGCSLHCLGTVEQEQLN